MYDYNAYKETENGYPIPAVGDDGKKGEYSYIRTDCGNYWFSICKDPMRRDGCLCPKCGKTIRIAESYKMWREQHEIH